MNCARYWREGVLLAERGEHDPHRDGCISCRREHRAREDIIHALPLVAVEARGDSGWEARVWNRIRCSESKQPERRSWRPSRIALVFAVASMGVPVCLLNLSRQSLTAMRPDITFAGNGKVVMRSTSPRVGDLVRIKVLPTDEIRVYCSDNLVFRCSAHSNLPGCRTDARAMEMEAQLPASGPCRVVTIPAITAPPVGDLYRDLEAVISAGGDYLIIDVPSD